MEPNKLKQKMYSIEQSFIDAKRELNLSYIEDNASLLYDALYEVFEHPDDYRLNVIDSRVASLYRSEDTNYDIKFVISDSTCNDQKHYDRCVISLKTYPERNTYYLSDDWYDGPQEDHTDGKSHYIGDYFYELKAFIEVLQKKISLESIEFKTWLSLCGLSVLVLDDNDYGIKVAEGV